MSTQEINDFVVSVSIMRSHQHLYKYLLNEAKQSNGKDAIALFKEAKRKLKQLKKSENRVDEALSKINLLKKEI